MNRRLRSILDSDSFEDFAPVRSCFASPASGPSGSKSRLGTTEELGMGFGASAGSVGFARDGGGGGGAGFVGGGLFAFLGGGGGFDANVRTD